MPIKVIALDLKDFIRVVFFGFEDIHEALAVSCAEMFERSFNIH